MSKNQFGSRVGVILASLGMAIGAGNLWRFPRLAGQYGGSFILLWMLFLFVWSLPLLLSEFAIGKTIKRNVIGSFGGLGGKGFTWMGFFVTFCTLGIAFYYSVVVAWSLRYLIISVDQLIHPVSLSSDVLIEQWSHISQGSVFTILLLVGVVLVASFILRKGIQNGLEIANKILVPSLFILLVSIAIVAFNLPNGGAGWKYMFHIDPLLFTEPTVWIEALSQSAWSTGAGWGLLLTISSYTREKEEVTVNVLTGAIGNNLASLLAGVAILPAVFALSSDSTAAIEYLKTGNQALTFTIIPQLFSTFSGGNFLTIIFFLALSLAAFTSLLAMFQMVYRLLEDYGIKENRQWLVMITVFILFGLPSAYSLEFFNNQDWVWGIGLVLSGFFTASLVLRVGVQKFKETRIDRFSDLRLPDWLFKYSLYLIICLAPILIIWWMGQEYSDNPWFKEGYWNWSDTYSNASIVTQWSLVLLIGIILNGWLYRRFCK